MNTICVAWLIRSLTVDESFSVLYVDACLYLAVFSKRLTGVACFFQEDMGPAKL